MHKEKSGRKCGVLLRFAMALGLLGLTLAPATAAAEPCTAISCYSKIERLYVRANGSILVRPMDGGLENLNCTPVSGKYLALRTSEQNFKELYSLLLSAALAKRQINIRITDGSTDCRIGYITVDG